MSKIVVRWQDAKGSVVEDGLSAIADARAAGTWVWVDVSGHDDAALVSLAETFRLHPLAVEDVQHDQRRAKLDVYPDSLFLAWLVPDHRRGDSVSARELDIFLGPGHLITIHRAPFPEVDKVGEDAGRMMAAGPDWTLHAVIDLLVDSTLPLIDRIGEDLSGLEDAMLERYRPEDLHRLHDIRRQLVRLHRIIAPERDMLRGLARERDVVSEDAYRYFQDVGDHIARVIDSIETYQDVGASVMDVFLSAQNNRMNEIMKQLTVVATIFMPLTLLSGIYGMNVLRGMWPPTEAVWSFPAVIASMLAIAGAMAVLFRRRNWW